MTTKFVTHPHTTIENLQNMIEAVKNEKIVEDESIIMDSGKVTIGSNLEKEEGIPPGSIWFDVLNPDGSTITFWASPEKLNETLM